MKIDNVSELRVGDKIRLTGKHWLKGAGYDGVQTVLRVDKSVRRFEFSGSPGSHWYLVPGWEIERVEPIKRGDTVRLVGRDWGKPTDTVTPYKIGTTHVVTDCGYSHTPADEWVRFEDQGFRWHLMEGWEVEVVPESDTNKRVREAYEDGRKVGRAEVLDALGSASRNLNTKYRG